MHFKTKTHCKCNVNGTFVHTEHIYFHGKNCIFYNPTFLLLVVFPVKNDWPSKKIAYKSLMQYRPFSVSKHRDVFLWVEFRWRQKHSANRFTNASYEVFLTISGENQILPAYVRSLTVQDCDWYLNKLT